MKNNDKKHAAAGMAVEIDSLVEMGVLPVGKFVTVETINPIYHGRLVAVTPSYYVLADACWLGDVGQRAEYERDGAMPAEANWMSDETPLLIERSSCLVIRAAHAKLQKALGR